MKNAISFKISHEICAVIFFMQIVPLFGQTPRKILPIYLFNSNEEKLTVQIGTEEPPVYTFTIENLKPSSTSGASDASEQGADKNKKKSFTVPYLEKDVIRRYLIDNSRMFKARNTSNSSSDQEAIRLELERITHAIRAQEIITEIDNGPTAGKLSIAKSGQAFLDGRRSDVFQVLQKGIQAGIGAIVEVIHQVPTI